MRPGKLYKLAALSFLILPSLPSRASSEATAITPPTPPLADNVLVLKTERKLILRKGAQVLKTYTTWLGGHPTGPKLMAGDRRTPEGTYILDRHNAQSQFHKSIHISYPNADDLARAKKLHVRPGGDLYIHGLPNNYPGYTGPGMRLGDWTDGCIALSNTEIDEIWDMVPDGTPIVIKP